MIARIQGLLDAQRLSAVEALLREATWEDGRATAGFQSAPVKRNLQLAQGSAAAQQAGDTILRALERHPDFISAALPRHVYPPLFNRYEPGMSFGAHVDNAVRQVPGTHHRLRIDLSATLFLSAREDYDGGELIIEDASDGQSVKLAAGDMILYPATTVHRVAPVTRGVRDAAFFWVQSMVRDDGARSILFDLDRSIAELAHTARDSPALVRLTGCYHNLIRCWAEP